MKNTRERYGLITAVTMIVGIVIGSGIFFKSDNILKATGGSVFLGVVVFVIGAIAIIFGGLCFGAHERLEREERAEVGRRSVVCRRQILFPDDSVELYPYN